MLEDQVVKSKDIYLLITVYLPLLNGELTAKDVCYCDIIAIIFLQTYLNPGFDIFDIYNGYNYYYC